MPVRPQMIDAVSAGPAKRGTALAMAALLFSFTSQRSQAQNPALSTPFVISKVQLVYSVVTHHSSISDRVNFFNVKGSPAGNANYAVPFLVCDPIVTLYNPSNTVATRSKVRVSIEDPPVGFKFKKNGDYVRPEFAAGEFQGMARFQIANENNPTARKSFTLLLRDRNGSGIPGASIILQPGESKEFAAWVESNWTWGLETSGGYTPRCFHDWNTTSDFTNRDGRTQNAFGVEFIPGWNPMAGFQMEHLSHSTRPVATRYDFEIANNWDGGWMGIKLTDTFSLEAKALRVLSQANLPDYKVDLLGGNIADKQSDLLRAFPMSLDNLRLGNPAQPVVARTFIVGDLLQAASDATPGGKTPFAALTMVAKTGALQANRFYEKPPLPTEALYEFHFGEVFDFNGTSLIVPPTDAPQHEAPVVTKVSRSGTSLFIDLATGNEPGQWLVKGTSNLEVGFPDDLTSQSIFISGPEGSGIGKTIINVAGLGERYFVRIEEAPGS